MPKLKKKKNHLPKLVAFLIKPFQLIRKRASSFLNRRPHRSFRLTKRRDYVKQFKLPGYLSFTKYVIGTIWKYKKQFLSIIFLYSLMTFLLVGMASQDSLTTFRETIDTVGSDFLSGSVGSLEKAGLLFLTAVSGGLNDGLTDIQQLYASLILVMVWLSCVWLLRNLLAGHKIKARDAVYNSGSPIIPTLLVSLLLMLQALPIALALIGYGAAASTGLLDGGVEAMMFWIAAILLGVLSLYWMTSTLISLVVVTLPGMYPYQAIKIGSDLVVGRRIKILMRFLWMLVVVAFVWAIILIPSLILDEWLKTIWSWYLAIPTIPILMLFLSAFAIVWTSSYVYLLYRKVVADDASSK